MRLTVKEWVEDVRTYIEHGNTAAIEQVINHPKMLYSTMALNEVARTGDHNLLAYALDHALGASIMDLTDVFKTLAHGGHAQSVQQLLEWAQSNNTFDAKNPYLRTVVMAAVERDCVDILYANAHQLHTIPQGFMKSYYFKAVECESLQSLEFFKEHMDTVQLHQKSLELAVDKLKPASGNYFLKACKYPMGQASSLALQVCLTHKILHLQDLTMETNNMLLMLMDHASPNQIVERFTNDPASHPLYVVLDHVHTHIRSEKQAQLLNSEIKDDRDVRTVGVGRKL